MKKTAFVLLVVGLIVSCGFGFANDSGNPIPSLSYWGWVCTYGPPPASFDAGCPPGPCGDGTLPSLVDGGDLPDSGADCQCDTGTDVPFANCSAGPCADGTVPTQTDGGLCLCDDGAALPEVDCQTPGPCADGTDPSFATGEAMDTGGAVLILDGGTCSCDDGTALPDADCETPDGG